MARMFSVGSTDGATRCIMITILTDSTIEGDETFTVALTSMTPGVMGNTVTIVTIADDEG